MGFFSKLISNDKDNSFDKICVDREILESVLYYAKEAYPHEFLSLFDGRIEDHVLYITSLIFIPGETSDTGAVLNMGMLPPTTKPLGSVHSHPGPSASPSDADLSTFSKNGLFHMIVCLPYSLETFRAYDKYGNELEYTVGDYKDKSLEDLDDFFDEEDRLTDDDYFSKEDEEFLSKVKKDKGHSYDDFENKIDSSEIPIMDLNDSKEETFREDNQLDSIIQKNKKVIDPFKDNVNTDEPIIINQNKVIINDENKDSFLKFSVNDGLKARDNELLINKNPSTLSNAVNIRSKPTVQVGKNSNKYQKKRKKIKKSKKR